MKRLLFTFITLLCLTSCSATSNRKPDIIPQQNSIVSVDVNGIEYSAKLNILPNGTLNMVFNYPDDIYGIEMKIDSQGCETKFGEVKFSYPEFTTDMCFKDLFDAISVVRTKEPETFTVDNDLLTADYGEYTVQYNIDKQFIAAVSSAKYNWNFQLLR